MEKLAYPCPCGGKIEWKRENVIIDNIECGMLDVEYCSRCGEEYFPESTMDIIERKLKEQGLWGVQRKEATLWKSGSSVVLRIPKDIAEKMKLKADEKVTIYPEGKKKLIIDL